MPLAEIEARIFRVIRTRIETKLESQREFDAWFMTTQSSLVKQVAQTIEHLTYSDAVFAVTYALQKLTFKAFVRVGNCISLAMKDFADGLPEPLTAAERCCFDQLYSPQPALGNIPLIMLRDKLQFAEGVIWNVLLRPDADSGIGTFIRLLQIYGELLGPRRRIDRERARSAKLGPILSLNEDMDSPAAPGDVDDVELHDEWTRVIDILRERYGLSCLCSRGSWKMNEPEPCGGTIRLTLTCQRCQQSFGPVELSIQEMRGYLGPDAADESA